LLVSGVLTVLGSGGGDVSEDGGVGGNYVWVYIEDPDTNTIGASVVDMSGSASCPDCPPTEWAFGYCPIGYPYVPGTAISVSWANHTTGESGTAFSAITGSCSCLFSYCGYSYRRGWWASVPLAMGVNAIEITASDSTGSSGSDSRTITRVPHIPGGVTASAGHGEVTVSWSGVSDATSYNIYWSTSRTLTKATGTKIADVSSPYIHSGLSDDVTYYYLVTAVNGGFESFASSVAWATAGWSTEAVADTLATTGQRDASIAVDSVGSPHMHYSYGDFFGTTSSRYNYYTTYAAGAWASVLVDHPEWVNANIALDSSGTVHVSYFASPGIRHAVYASGNWTAEVADSQGWCDSSLALDSAGKAHVAYKASSMSGHELRYATNTSGSWASSVVDAFATLGCDFVGRRVSVAVDAAGIAHIAYAGDYPDYGLKYATNQGGSWAITVVDQVYVQQLSSAVDANGKAHVVYADNMSRLRYAHNVAGTWAVEDIEREGSPQYPSLALDAAGKAHVSYFYNRYGELRYAKNSSGAWQVGVVANVGYAAPNSDTDTAIAVDSLGKAHIGYFDNYSGSLKYATNK
jgi:hypothetical protein